MFSKRKLPQNVYSPFLLSKWLPRLEYKIQKVSIFAYVVHCGHPGVSNNAYHRHRHSLNIFWVNELMKLNELASGRILSKFWAVINVNMIRSRTKKEAGRWGSIKPQLNFGVHWKRRKPSNIGIYYYKVLILGWNFPESIL